MRCWVFLFFLVGMVVLGKREYTTDDGKQYSFRAVDVTPPEDSVQNAYLGVNVIVNEAIKFFNEYGIVVNMTLVDEIVKHEITKTGYALGGQVVARPKCKTGWQYNDPYCHYTFDGAVMPL